MYVVVIFVMLIAVLFYMCVFITYKCDDLNKEVVWQAQAHIETGLQVYRE